MLALLVSMALAAPLKLGTAGFSHAGISAETAGLLQDAVANRLATKPGFEVITSADIAAALGRERQRILAGCAEAGTECAVELAGALGADGLLTGSVGKVGASFVLNVKVVSARDARPLFVHASRALPSEEALLEEAVAVADLIAERLAPAGHLTAGAGAATWQPWLLVVGGALAAGGGAVFAGLASANLGVLEGRSPMPMGGTPESMRDGGKLFQGLGIGLLAGGGALMLTGVIWKAAAPRAPVAALLWAGPGVGFAALRMELP